MSDFKDDFRQTYVISKHEFSKILYGKTALTSLIIIFALIAAVFVLNCSLVPEYTFYADTYLDTASKFFIPAVVIISVLTSSGMFSSEYETRTGLLMFTKPVRRGSIFAGKVLTSVLFIVLITAVFYIANAVIILAYTGELSEMVLPIAVIMMSYAIGVTGVILLLSSIFKKTSLSTAAALVLLLVIGQIISFNYQTLTSELWFSLSYSAQAVNTIIYDMSSYIIDSNPPIPDFAGTSYADPTLSVMVMLAYGVFSILYAYIFFSMREM